MRFATLAEWLTWQETLHPNYIDLGLTRVASVFKHLFPKTKKNLFPFTITVGGTNGKGSCVAMLDTLFRAAGYQVGAYTSPHLLRYNERIQIGGCPVEDACLVEAFERVDTARGNTSLSFFEFGTLAALDIFSKNALDVQILEVGLGGRLDAVNLIDADISVIASIDIDHEAWLGSTREAIGFEKAGIFRTARPAILGDPHAPSSILEVCETHSIPLYRLGHEFGYTSFDTHWTWWSSNTCLEKLPFPSIPGTHQFMNAATVLETLRHAADHIPVSDTVIRESFNHIRLPGRFQYFPGPIPILLDVAHNPQATRLLAEYIRIQHEGKHVHAVFAVMRDKDIPGMIHALHKVVDTWYLAPLQIARAIPPGELADLFRLHAIQKVKWGFSTVLDAVSAAQQNAKIGDIIVVFGSFFLASEYLTKM